MSGHSKWSTIKRQKAVTDAKRAKVFTKLARLITIAARQGGDPAMNFRLRLAIDQARSANVPNDNIERAIKAGTGVGRGGQAKEVIYEGYGPGGVAILVEAVTANPNRTAAEVRSVFSKHDGRLGAQHSVSWMFVRRGVTTVELNSLSPAQREKLELALIDLGLDDLREDGQRLTILSTPEQLPAVRQVLQTAQVNVESAGLELVPTTSVMIEPPLADRLYMLLEDLEELDEVTQVYCNES